jgi:hypothetical protein
MSGANQQHQDDCIEELRPLRECVATPKTQFLHPLWEKKETPSKKIHLLWA